MILPSLSLGENQSSPFRFRVVGIQLQLKYIFQTYVNQFHASALFIENNVQTSLDISVNQKIPSSTSSLTKNLQHLHRHKGIAGGIVDLFL